MKKIALLFLILFVGCTHPEKDYKVEYLKLIDSIETVKSQHQQLDLYIHTLRDSIVTLQQCPLMTSEQFIELYKYESLRKYYQICKKNPTQKKYYWGWTSRVLEQ
jgi:hypothetical protein